jgi:hypothetical protein
MSKKDFIVKENVDREPDEKPSQVNETDKKNEQGFTEVKNANASGLGSMGRTDASENVKGE